MLAIKHERIYQIEREFKNPYIFRAVSQNNSAINSQLARALFISIYYNDYYF